MDQRWHYNPEYLILKDDSCECLLALTQMTLICNLKRPRIFAFISLSLFKILLLRIYYKLSTLHHLIRYHSDINLHSFADQEKSPQITRGFIWATSGLTLRFLRFSPLTAGKCWHFKELQLCVFTFLSHRYIYNINVSQSKQHSVFPSPHTQFVRNFQLFKRTHMKPEHGLFLTFFFAYFTQWNKKHVACLIILGLTRIIDFSVILKLCTN